MPKGEKDQKRKKCLISCGFCFPERPSCVQRYPAPTVAAREERLAYRAHASRAGCPPPPELPELLYAKRIAVVADQLICAMVLSS